MSEHDIRKASLRGTDLTDEMEKAAQGFEQRDLPFAALCLRKALKTFEPPREHADASPAPGDTSAFAEAHKMLDALETHDTGLAALFLRKAIKGFQAAYPAGLPAVADPAAALQEAQELSQAIEEQDHSGAADLLRNLAARLAPAREAEAETEA